jgi:Ran GTPase-activating protein (RanGAP) involved in mRNA processing and transport
MESDGNKTPRHFLSIASMLKVNKTLEELDMSCNRIGTCGAEAIANILRVNESLYKLNLSSCGITDEDACIITKALCTNSTLKVLQFYGIRSGRTTSNSR